jgi:hypothetical protein
MLLAVVSAASARAHALGVECRIENGRVVVEAYFSDNTPGRSAEVTVRDAARNVVVQGRTDDYGRWSFPSPRSGDYEVAVDAGVGHRTAVHLTIPAVGNSPSMVVSTGPSRSEFTSTPWFRIGLGLFLIAAVTFGLRLWKRRRGAPAAAPPNA